VRALREAAAIATTTSTTSNDTAASAAQLAAAQRSVTVAEERAAAAEHMLTELRTRLDAETTARHSAEVTCLTIAEQVYVQALLLFKQVSQLQSCYFC
jgi:uncharacterized protein YPO0396